MTLQQICDVLHGTSPFVIHLVSGREFRVPHPDYAALAVGDASLVFTSDTGSLELIRLSQIESITLSKESAA
jgi:hypothetical protein